MRHYQERKLTFSSTSPAQWLPPSKCCQSVSVSQQPSVILERSLNRMVCEQCSLAGSQTGRGNSLLVIWIEDWRKNEPGMADSHVKS